MGLTSQVRGWAGMTGLPDAGWAKHLVSGAGLLQPNLDTVHVVLRLHSRSPRGLTKCSRRLQIKTGQSLGRVDRNCLGLSFLISLSPIWRHPAQAAWLQVTPGPERTLIRREAALTTHMQGRCRAPFCYFLVRGPNGREVLQ